MAEHSLTMRNTVGDLLRHPIGADLIEKVLLQMGASSKWVDNALVRRMRLSTLHRLTRSRMDVVPSLLDMLNRCADISRAPSGAPVTKAWWKEAVVYQVYPRSFLDTDGDGVGDIPGILQKLDYLQALGVDALWLSPVYDSPFDDNGYDIRDYERIAAQFGTMRDMERLIEELHGRGMRLIMDMVLNHTSDEHAWFAGAVNGIEPYVDYYISAPYRDDTPPNNWTSVFGGGAWKHVGDRWWLHLFSPKQMDLNWKNGRMRSELYAMMNRWLDKGVDGFRFDVINLISKTEGLPDGNAAIGAMMGYTGAEHYFFGPELQTRLREMRGQTYGPRGAMSVGEMPGVGKRANRLLTAEDRGQLDMSIRFEHLENPGKSRFDDYAYNLTFLKRQVLSEADADNACWNAWYWENHDNPRMISKIEKDASLHPPLGKLLALWLLTLRGTPFIYQGQELGMVNAGFASISELRDIESLRMYREFCRSMPEREAWSKVLAGSRDHGRVPMPWNGGINHGFTAGEPWIRMGSGTDSAERQEADASSLLHFYRRAIALRKKHAALVYGDFRCLRGHKDTFVYERADERECFVVQLNLTRSPKPLQRVGGELLLGNYDGEAARLRPYEARLYKRI